MESIKVNWWWYMRCQVKGHFAAFHKSSSFSNVLDEYLDHVNSIDIVIIWWKRDNAAKNLGPPFLQPCISWLPRNTWTLIRSHSTMTRNWRLPFLQARTLLLSFVSHNTCLFFQLYGLYKQATVGDCQSSRPSLFEFVARAKWDAWNALKGMPQEQAKENYVDYVERLDVGWSRQGEYEYDPKETTEV